MADDSSLYGTGGSFGDGSQTPPSDVDPYSAGSNPLSSPFAQYPTKIELPPQSILSMVKGTSHATYEARATRIICHGLDHIRFITHRWPTQQETDAMISRVRSYDAFPVAGMGLGLAAATPFYRRTKFRVNWLAMLSRLPRGVLLLSFAAAGYGLGEWSSNVREITRIVWDPRMATALQDLNSIGRDEIVKRNREFEEYEKTRRRLRPRQTASPYPAPAGPGSTGDNARPATDTFPSDPEQTYDGQQGNSRILGEVYARPGEEQAHGAASQRQPSHGTSSSNESNQTTDIFGDDESGSSSFSSSDPKPSGAAWDRIRQQYKSPSPQQQQQQQQQSRWQGIQQQSQQSQSPQSDQSVSPQSSSWSFSPSSYPSQEPSHDTTTTNSEKEKAQREFDELLDRERNFGSGADGAYESGGTQDGGRGRRW